LSNKQQILISIILPTFNHAKFLKKAVESVVNQSYIHWELIIVDNNSTDNTIDIVKSYSDKRIKYFKIQNYGVIAASRNLGISKAKGSWIAFLDSDDWWTPDKLIKCVKYLDNNTFDLIYHDLFLVSKPNQSIFKKLAKSRNLNSPIFEDLILNGNGILNSSALVRKDLLQRVGLLSCDLNKITWEDYDCWLRISKKTNQFHYIKETLGYYWAAGGNMTNPDRDLENANSIYNCYIKGHYDKIPSWILFSQGKALVKKGLIKEGISKYREISIVNYSFMEFFKANIKILETFLCKFKG